MNTIKLHNTIAEVCPITSISIGDKLDKTTWTFNAQKSATAEQAAKAQSVIDNVDLSILDDVKYIPKLAIIDRLIALGKLSDAMTALNSDATKKARWDAATEIRIDDADVIAVLAALVIEPSTVLY